MHLSKCITPLPLFALLALLASSCTRTEIEFGTVPDNGYTNLVYVDTVTAQLSTVIKDSFATGSATTFLVGRYRDPYLGTVTGKAFFQVGVPAAHADIPLTCTFDSITLIIRPNDYYYGDTTRAETINVYELSQSIVAGYNNQLYNTSDVPVKSTALGSRRLVIKPTALDSISIRLNDSKGAELFSKLQQLSTDLAADDAFLNYFKGVSISVNAGDTAALFGIQGADSSLVMRVHYHNTIPYPEPGFIDFPFRANTLAFNQVIPNRSGTGIVSNGGDNTELASGSTNHFAFSQAGTGLFLKMTFPSLRTILNDKTTVKLMKAELLIRPTYLSFDKDKYRLPSQLYLTSTDASNLLGNTLLDSTGSTIQYVGPTLDDIYGENNYYRFNVTSYINSLLTTNGSEDDGVFVMENPTASGRDVNRMIVNDPVYKGQPAQLLLSVLIVNK